jgi:hypothetical protein
MLVVVVSREKMGRMTSTACDMEMLQGNTVLGTGLLAYYTSYLGGSWQKASQGKISMRP